MKPLLTLSLTLLVLTMLALPVSAFNTNVPTYTTSADMQDYYNVTEPTSDNGYGSVTIINRIGDNDGYGYGGDVVADGADLPRTDNPFPDNGWLFDNRSADEMAATDGAQGTDLEAAFDMTFHHSFDISTFDELSEALFIIDISGLQQGVWGGFSHLYIDGVEMVDFLNINQGAWGSGIFTFAVDLAMLADGALDVYFDGWNDQYGADDVAIDFTKLAVTGTSAVPEPATMLLLGLGMAGMGMYRKYRG